MAELTTKRRERLKNDFAYVDRQAAEHLPIHDEAHARNAIARWNQTDFESASAKEEARKKIIRAAKKFGVQISKDDKVMKGGAA